MFHGEDKNPFVLPSDEEVFRMRDTERRMKTVERERQHTLKVWEKSTGSAHRSSKVSELMGEPDESRRRGALVSAARTVLGGAEQRHKPEKVNLGQLFPRVASTVNLYHNFF